MTVLEIACGIVLLAAALAGIIAACLKDHPACRREGKERRE